MAQGTPATQTFLPIKEITEDVVVLLNGQLCGILLTTSVNLALKSHDEQTAVIRQFQGFLNSLDFSVQVSPLRCASVSHLSPVARRYATQRSHACTAPRIYGIH